MLGIMCYHMLLDCAVSEAHHPYQVLMKAVPKKKIIILFLRDQQPPKAFGIF